MLLLQYFDQSAPLFSLSKSELKVLTVIDWTHEDLVHEQVKLSDAFWLELAYLVAK
jgi:hypothetical protein